MAAPAGLLMVYDETYAAHLRGVAHPESPDRVERVAQHLRDAGLFDERLGARGATDAEMERVHPHAYIERVKRDIDALGGRRHRLSLDR